MLSIKNKKKAKRRSIHLRIRKRIKGTVDRPRLSVYKTNRAIYAQLIDDDRGHTVLSGNSLQLKGKSIKHAIQMAEDLAKRALAKNITQVVFDRSGYPYHGVIKEFSKSASQNGLKH
ncbi:MAG: 50S ribosomal protein L18 [Bacteroidota bacterium]